MTAPARNTPKISAAFLFAALLTCTHPAVAGEGHFLFDRLGIEDGLSQSNVRAVLQDREGYMWFGTMDGLTRYDGDRMVVYRHNPDDPDNTIADNEITNLFEDRDGGIWVATAGGGLNLIDKKTGRISSYWYDPGDPESFGGGEITVMYQDSRGSFWVGTRTGLNRFNAATRSFTRFRYVDGGDVNVINCIREGPDGSVWFGTDAGLKKYDPHAGSFVSYDAAVSRASRIGRKMITSIAVDMRERLWVGTPMGVYVIDEPAGRVRHYDRSGTNSSSLSGDRVFFIEADPDERMWISTSGGLDLFDLKSDRFRHFGLPRDVSDDSTAGHYLGFLADFDGLVWLRTGKGKLYAFDPERETFTPHRYNFRDPHSVGGNHITCMSQDRSGTLWFGTEEGGVSKLSKSKIKFETLNAGADGAHGLSNMSVRALIGDRSDNIWVGTAENGVAKIDGKSGAIVWNRRGQGKPGSISDDRIVAMTIDANGAVWAATAAHTLGRFSPSGREFSEYRYAGGTAAGAGTAAILALHGDRSGYVWIGTSSGVSRYSTATGATENFDLDEGLGLVDSGVAITTFYEDSTGVMWMGTSTGHLVRLDVASKWAEGYIIKPRQLARKYSSITSIAGYGRGTLLVGTAASGLYEFDIASQTFGNVEGSGPELTHRINTILPDGRGQVWISTNYGVTRHDLSSHTSRNFDFTDGLQGNGFNVGAGAVLGDGSVLFGGMNGVSVMRPSTFRENTSVPLLTLTSFRKFNREVVVSERQGGTPFIELAYDDNFFTLEFAAMDFTTPESNQYAYFLEGVDQGWIYSGNRHVVSYTHIDPGTYVFRFKGSNNDGVWNEEGSSIIISIMPPFWNTSWFQLIGAVSVILSVYYSYRFKVRSIKTQKETLETVVRNRTKELWEITRELRSARDQLEFRVSERTVELRNANELLRSEITERIETQDELQRLKDFHENLVDTMTEGVSVVDSGGTLTYVNPAAARLLGYTQEELLGKHWSMLVPSNMRGHVQAADERRKAGLSDHYELQMLRKDGSRVHVFVGGGPIITDGILQGTIAVFTDITGLKTAESRIKEQAALIDKARDVIVVTDVGGNITYWNRSAETVYGWKSEEVLGKNVHNLLQGKTDSTSADAARVILEQGQWSGELAHLSREGKTVTMQSRWSLVNDVEGFPKSIMMINTDITEKVKLEKQFLRAQRMEGLGTLASGIAHDLNNVLAPIIMAIQVLRSRRTDEQEKTLLTTMELSAKRGADIVKQVLMFARGAEGKHEELQLKHLVREMETIVRETFPKSIECVADVPRDLWPISGDPTQLHQVLLNLCVNARDAMPGGGKLTITAENVGLENFELQLHPEKLTGQYIVLSVTDTGHGMTQDTMMKIFEPFFTTKGVGKGTGLGLSTVNGIIKGHGGVTQVYSEPGRGTTFRIYFPAVVKGADGKKPDGAASLPVGRGETILLVDDEPAIRQITKGTLETYGYRVLTAGDGVEAEEVYRENMKDVVLVITDMMMPVRDGRETIRILRSINPSLKIVVTSGLISTEKEDDGWRKQTQGFIAKPFTAEVLLRTLDDVLELRKN